MLIEDSRDGEVDTMYQGGSTVGRQTIHTEPRMSVGGMNRTTNPNLDSSNGMIMNVPTVKEEGDSFMDSEG